MFKRLCSGAILRQEGAIACSVCVCRPLHMHRSVEDLATSSQLWTFVGPLHDGQTSCMVV